MSEITDIEAWEVLDSRGNPTVRVLTKTEQAEGTFTVPAGASTGAHEAIEKRDGEQRYRGQGVQSVVQSIENEISPLIVGYDVYDQIGIDETMLQYDGTENISNMGANASLGVSGSVSHAASNDSGMPLYQYLAPDSAGSIPLPMINILSGGLHAEGGVEIQDFLIIPVGATSYEEAIEMVWEIRQTTRDRIISQGYRPLVADEGGFSPPLESISSAFDLLEECTLDAGFEIGSDIAFAVDIAASHFYDENEKVYRLDSVNKTLSPREMVDLVTEWVDMYPVISLEDPLAEDDWKHWSQLKSSLGESVQLLGDDLLVTNEDRLKKAKEYNSANAVLIKPNQVGTITETIRVIEQAKQNGFSTVVSARSGETSDTTIVDLAVAFDAGQIKVGSLARSERLAKYNRLNRIARDHTNKISEFPSST